MKCYSGPYSGRTSLRDLGGWLARGAAWWVTAQMVVGAGDIRFTEVIDGAPVVVNRQLLGAAWGDFDDDGRVDLYGAGVDSGPGELFRNTAARFVRVEEGVVATDSWRRAGAAWGDYDNDGWPDLLVVGATADPLAVYHNLGGKGFAKLGTVSGFTPAVGMSGIWVDYDNDGWLDFFCVNGGGAQGQPNGLYHNDGQG